MDQKIRGVIVPILTPLNADETVDTQSLRRLVNYLIDKGVHGIWVSGTTGEFAALPDRQRLISMETVVDEVAGRVAIIGNVSGVSTQLSLQMALDVQEMGTMTISGRAENENPVPGSTEPRYGLDHFGFETDDLAGLAASLKGNGVKFNCEPWTMPSGSMVAFVVAPDEVSVELIQRPS